jgi:hypothetical protein
MKLFGNRHNMGFLNEGNLAMFEPLATPNDEQTAPC